MFYKISALTDAREERPHAATALCRRLAAAEWDEVMGMARAAFRGSDPDALRSAVLRAACEAANEKFPRPTWSGPRADRARVRLNLDARCVRGVRCVRGGGYALTAHLPRQIAQPDAREGSFEDDTTHTGPFLG